MLDLQANTFLDLRLGLAVAIIDLGVTPHPVST